MAKHIPNYVHRFLRVGLTIWDTYHQFEGRILHHEQVRSMRVRGQTLVADDLRNSISYTEYWLDCASSVTGRRQHAWLYKSKGMAAFERVCACIGLLCPILLIRVIRDENSVASVRISVNEETEGKKKVSCVFPLRTLSICLSMFYHYHLFGGGALDGWIVALLGESYRSL